MHVTGVALVPDGGDTNLGLGHVILGETDAVEDGLGSALGFGFGDAGAVLVELLLLCGCGLGWRWRIDGDGGSE